MLTDVKFHLENHRSFAWLTNSFDIVDLNETPNGCYTYATLRLQQPDKNVKERNYTSDCSPETLRQENTKSKQVERYPTTTIHRHKACSATIIKAKLIIIIGRSSIRLIKNPKKPGRDIINQLGRKI